MAKTASDNRTAGDKRDKQRDSRVKYTVFSFLDYVLIFLAVCFVTTASIMVFLSNADADIPVETITLRARLTFINVFVMALFLTLIIRISRKIKIERPIKHILEATDRISAGDFSVRIPKRNGLRLGNEFDVIIENINSMAEELSGVESLRTDFISNVSHELKTPLAVIQNYATILQDPNLDDEKRIEYALSITQASRHLTSLITNILKLNKLENQQIFPQKTRFNLSEQLAECLLEFESIWEERQIELNAEIDDDVFVQSDPELLSLVWHNLFSNAFKFTLTGGTVTVSLSQSENGTTVRVADTGCGMSAETQKHIFEKFYQGDTSHATKGNGLGLALVKRVCDITGASISVESAEGKGSAFTVRI